MTRVGSRATPSDRAVLPPGDDLDRGPASATLRRGPLSRRELFSHRPSVAVARSDAAPERAANLSMFKLGVTGWLVYQAARRYSVRPGEEETFVDTWKTYKSFVERSGEGGRRRGIDRVQTALADIDAALVGKGPLDALRLPVSGRYVIFSDHHNTQEGHRHDYFEVNRPVFTHALSEYYDAGFTLVEDGDVEELVVYDPALDQGEAGLRAKLSFAGLEARREEFRAEQLRLLLNEPRQQAMWSQIERFHSDGRWVRIIGNHDVDEKSPVFDAIMEERFPGFHARDILFLDNADGQAEYAVLHGHQFDAWSNEDDAARAGETISENLAIWFEGSDKHWKSDETTPLLSGRAALPNELVSARPGTRETPHRAPALTDDTRAPLLDVEPLASERGFGARLFEFLAEKLAGHAISWEYFEAADSPGRAFRREVMGGERFIKFRHMDEQVISRELDAAPDRERPTLVLGHTHEPRFEARWPNGGAVETRMMNCGSAGRYDNLVFGIEIVDGEASLISWSQVDGQMQRRVWDVMDDAEGHRWLRARPVAEPLP